jgi:sugar O-acyltransferase (sialic acid O-acetyltransferase NeuD family)
MTEACDLLIIGTGGLAKEVAQLARRIDPKWRRWHTIEYVTHHKEEMGSARPHGTIRWLDQDLLARKTGCDVAIAIGEPRTRRRIAALLAENAALRFPNLIHPSVEIDFDLVQLGHGNLIMQGVIMTCDISVEHFNVFNWHVTVGHDAIVGSFNVINPGSNLSGYTRIGDACLLGTGCQILEHLTITSDVSIGAGAVVIADINEAGTYVGVPAKRAR